MTPWSARRPVILGILALCALLAGFGYWSVRATLSGAIIAGGQIEVDQNRQVVQHPDGGVVAEIAVSEGDFVNIGAPLLRLDDAQLASELAITEGQLFEVMARRARLEAERDNATTLTFDTELQERANTDPDVAQLMEGQTRLFEARRTSVAQRTDQLREQTAQIENQIGGIDAQLAALNAQMRLLREELANQQELLDKGLAQASRVLALQRSEADIAGTLGELDAARAQAEGRISEIKITILSLTSTRREQAITELRDIAFQERNALEQRRSLRERLSRLTIAAPVSGVVYGMTVFTPRSVIRPADPLLYLVPQDRPLVVAAQVDPIHVDQVFVDQDVKVRFSAFDQRTTPELSGRVTQLSADAFQDQSTRASYYRATIELAPGELAKLPEGKPLIPGMPVETFIQTEDRTPLEYLVQPLADYFARAFRES